MDFSWVIPLRFGDYLSPNPSLDMPPHLARVLEFEELETDTRINELGVP